MNNTPWIRMLFCCDSRSHCKSRIWLDGGINFLGLLLWVTDISIAFSVASRYAVDSSQHIHPSWAQYHQRGASTAPRSLVVLLVALVFVTKYECVTELHQYSLNRHIKQPEKCFVQNFNKFWWWQLLLRKRFKR